MVKVAMIGAGSVVFSKNLTGDILSYPEFKNATLSYMDIDAERLEVGAALCRKVAQKLGANPTIEATLDRRKALAGADFVINMVQIGGFDSTLVDFEIPRKYGLNFTIADTTGPGALFRALRTYPMLTGLCRDMEELCPRAVLLNYSNPMSMNMQTVFRASNIRGVGLCHSIQHTLDQLLRYIKEDPKDVTFLAAGVNHMTFYLRLEKDGVDLYPRLFKAMEDPAIYSTNRVRFELMRRLGYFVTESSEHNAEYSSWFIPRGAKTIAEFSVPIDEYLRRCDSIVDEFDRLKAFSKSDEPIEVVRSHEYGSTIIHSMATGQPSVVYGNMPNNGAIASLPRTAIVELPTLVDRAGPQLTTVGEIPPQLVAYMMPHVQQHELFIRAAMEGRRDHIYQAAMFDPLTAATLTLDQIVHMCDELIAGHGDLLPSLDAKKSLVPTSGKMFGAVDPKELRKSWDAQQSKPLLEAVKHWKVIGPFPASTPTSKAVSLDLPTPLEKAIGPEGAIDLKAGCRVGSKTLKWQSADADDAGYVDLIAALGKHEYCVAYAYTEIDSVHAYDAILTCGSDDGIRIWVDGKMVHNNDVGRGYTPAADKALAHLKSGKSRILMKISQYTGGWGFGLRVSKPSF